MPIDPTIGVSIAASAPKGLGAPGAPAPGAPGSFRDFLVQSIEEVNRMQQTAEAATDALASGKTDNLTEVYSAVAQSKVAFDLMLEVRNKLIDAYNEVLRMRV